MSTDNPQIDALLAARHGQPAETRRQADDFGGIPVPDAYRPLVLEAAAQHNVPPAYLAWLLKRESSFNPKALGIPTKYGRAMGIAQYMPATARERGVDPWDPASAIPGAASYLAELAGKTGSWERALARYGTFSTGRGPEADAKVRESFRQFARTGRFGDEAPRTSGLAAERADPVRRAMVPYYPDPEDLQDPLEVLWNAYSDDDHLTRILGRV